MPCLVVSGDILVNLFDYLISSYFLLLVIMYIIIPNGVFFIVVLSYPSTISELISFSCYC